MALVNIRVRGATRVTARLSGISKRLKNAKPLFRVLGQQLSAHYGRNMLRGVDPRGRPLAPTQRWTRFLSPQVGVANAATGAKTPLVRTGTMRTSMGPKEITNTRLRFGFQRDGIERAEAMVDGTPGRMKVRSELIRTTKSGPNAGLQYVRILTNSGQWFTKRVRGGFVPVKPQKRDFFFLTSRQQRLIERIAQRYVETAVNR